MFLQVCEPEKKCSAGTYTTQCSKNEKKVFIARGLIRNACYSSIFANI